MSEHEDDRFNILVCIDGSEESYRGLHYAIKFSLDHADTDISLLYVRAEGMAERSSGLNMNLARENLLDWDIELPGLAALKKARDMLVDSGFLGEEWGAEDITKKFRGTRSGDHIVKYTSNKTDQHISLIVRESSSVLTGILDEGHFYHYDIIIVSAAQGSASSAGHIDTYTAIGVATEHDGTVILVRELEEGHGHFICVEDTEVSMEMVRKDALMAKRCNCPIYLYSVAEDDEGLDQAQHALDCIGARAGPVEPFEHLEKGGQEATEDRLVELALVLEMIEEARPANPDPIADLGQRGAPKSAF